MHQLDVLKYVRKDEKKTGKVKKKKGKKTVPTSSTRYLKVILHLAQNYCSLFAGIITIKPPRVGALRR